MGGNHGREPSTRVGALLSSPLQVTSSGSAPAPGPRAQPSAARISRPWPLATALLLLPLVFFAGVMVGFTLGTHGSRYFLSAARATPPAAGASAPPVAPGPLQRALMALLGLTAPPLPFPASLPPTRPPAPPPEASPTPPPAPPPSLARLPLAHGLDDEELLWLASAVPQRRGPPPQRPPKVAFLFLTRGPLPLAPLWARFFAGHDGLFSVYIHAQPNKTYAPDELPPPFRGRQVSAKETRWGDISIVDAERRLLANALLDDAANECFVLVSETCAPLYAFPAVYAFFARSRLSFVEVHDDRGPYGRGRYNGNFLPEVTLEQWRKGSQWLEVRRPLAVAIVADTKYYPKFRDFCKPYCYVDEHYFPTMLAILHPGDVAARSPTYVDWSRGGFHPATFGAAHVTPALVAAAAGAPIAACSRARCGSTRPLR